MRFAWVLTCFLTVLGSAANAAPYATAWVEGHNSKTRLIVGGALGDDGTIERYAALEIALPSGWKTYWRQPGNSGGIPPHVSWQGSKNLRSLTVLYPAPIRMPDPNGESIGYKKNVVFPLRLELVQPATAVKLDLSVFFGVCREICIPAEAKFEVTVPPNLFQQTPPELAAGLNKVPRVQEPAARPKLENVSVKSGPDGSHIILFEVDYGSDNAAPDLFVETGDLMPLAMTKQVGAQGGNVRFQLAVADMEDWNALKKKGFVATMVSKAGAREVRSALPE